MKLLRLVLVLLLALAVPGTALAAVMSNGHCAKHAAASEAHGAHHAGHGGHAVPDGATKAPTGLQCDCGCACAGAHCAGASVALASVVASGFSSRATATEFARTTGHLALAHTLGLLRPPSLLIG